MSQVHFVCKVLSFSFKCFKFFRVLSSLLYFSKDCQGLSCWYNMRLYGTFGVLVLVVRNKVNSLFIWLWSEKKFGVWQKKLSLKIFQSQKFGLEKYWSEKNLSAPKTEKKVLVTKKNYVEKNLWLKIFLVEIIFRLT